MKQEPDSIKIRELDELPPVTVSANFTGRVLARLEGPRRRLGRSPVQPLLAAAAVVLALVAVARHRLDERVQGDARLELESLRLELSSLRQTIEAQSVERRAAPVVFLAGDELTDVVLDLRHLREHAEEFPIRPDQIQ